MKQAYIFPGQGSQAPGMGKDLYQSSEKAHALFTMANDILGFNISKIMFEGTVEELQKTSVTQPAIYIHSVILAELLEISKEASMVAGHSLGEFSALASMGAISFEDGLKLVAERSAAMQAACDAVPSTMAAIIGLDDETVETLCHEINGIVVPANYNAPGQLVISGEIEAVEAAMAMAKLKGARMVTRLNVNGAFHSPLMEPARQRLALAISNTNFKKPSAPIYQNVSAKPETDPEKIRAQLIAQLTAPVRWAQSVKQMVADGATAFIEIGPGKVLQGLVKRIESGVSTTGKSSL